MWVLIKLQILQFILMTISLISLETGTKLNVHKTFRICTFSLVSVSRRGGGGDVVIVNVYYIVHKYSKGIHISPLDWNSFFSHNKAWNYHTFYIYFLHVIWITCSILQSIISKLSASFTEKVQSGGKINVKVRKKTVLISWILR